MSEDDAKSAETDSPFAGFERPVIVFVDGPGSADEVIDKIETIVFKNEKIGLAMKAFRTVKIDPANAADDAYVSEHGKTVPRLLLIDPVKEKVKVLEAKRIKVSALYSAMKKVAAGFYKEKLDKVVKQHLRLLNERDKLASEMKRLQDRETRLADEDGPAAKRKLQKVVKEREDLTGELEELAGQERDLWKLTPKAAKKHTA